MPLTPAIARHPMHQRTLELQGYLRDDGLWDIEARMVDRKSIDMQTDAGVTRRAGESIHDIWLRISVDDDRVIRAVEVAMDSAPFPTCTDVQRSLDPLVGEQIGAGWRDMLRRKVHRRATCTHLFELLAPLASAVFQTLSHGKDGRDRLPGQAHDGAIGKPFFLDGCYTWRADGPLVHRVYPLFKRNASDDG